ncbi:hypothetical protein [Amycolatopsis benzoatilytica]|uniref:hypothetical protein n=1 Tax=Amycolatopsis benzoatilytica TaxID=346045 RepID=UPI0003821AD1|nr:hypothetical protein [Amycolatopsis benzoatilytica]
MSQIKNPLTVIELVHAHLETAFSRELEHIRSFGDDRYTAARALGFELAYLFGVTEGSYGLDSDVINERFEKTLGALS